MHAPTAQRNSKRAREGRCPACGRRLSRSDHRVRVAGALFHRQCAVYQPGSATGRGRS